MVGLCRLRAVAQAELRRVIYNRAYGSAAAAQLDYNYDHDYCEEYGAEPDPIWAMEDSQGSVPERGVQWVIMGDPVARKHVYAERLSKLLQVPHISMGTLVRQELHPRSSLYKQAILDQIADIDLVVNLKCTESLLKEHLEKGIFSHNQELLGLSSSGLKSTSADSEGVWKEKLCNYAKQSKPLEDYYREQKKLFDFKVAGAPGETWQGLLSALHLQHMNAVNLSQKLTA